MYNIIVITESRPNKRPSWKRAALTVAKPLSTHSARLLVIMSDLQCATIKYVCGRREFIDSTPPVGGVSYKIDGINCLVNL